MRYLLSFFLSCLVLNTWALKPSREYSYLPDTISFPGFRSETIVTSDGYHLKAWRFKPFGSPVPERHQTVLIVGGDSGNMGNWLYLVKALLLNGYSVVTFDYRGFGQSDDFLIDPDRLYYSEFTEDFKAAVRYVNASKPKTEALVVYAFSMGTIVAVDGWQDSPASYFIAEGFIYDPLAAQRRLQILKPGRMFMVPADASQHPDRLKSLPEKVLVFVGSEDKVATKEDCKQLSMLRPKLIVKEFAGGHGGGFNALMQIWGVIEKVN